MEANGKRGWSAVDKATNIAGHERELVVSGIVHLPSTSHKASLRETVPPGINDRILMLDLVIEQHGIGADVMTTREVGYEKRPVERGAYGQVEILQDGERLEIVDVQIIES